MKHFIRNTAALGAVLTVLGLGLALGAEMNGADLSPDGNLNVNFLDLLVWRNRPESMEREWEKQIPSDAFFGESSQEDTLSFSAVNKLDISLETGEISWISSDQERILVKTEGSPTDSRRYQIYQEGDELYIRGRGVQGGEIVPKIEIQVPAGYRFQEVEIQVGAGEFQGEGVMADQLEMKVAAGDGTLQGAEAGELSLSCAAGDISYEGKILREGEAECRAGTISLLLDNREEDFNYEIEGTGGSIRIGDLNFDSGFARNDVDHNAEGSLELKAWAGDIDVEFKEENAG